MKISEFIIELLTDLDFDTTITQQLFDELVESVVSEYQIKKTDAQRIVTKQLRHLYIKAG
jgi:predicted RNA-binding protein Jag